MADEMFNLFKFGVTYDPTRIDPETGKTLGELRGYEEGTPTELSLTQQQIAAESELLPYQVAQQKALLESQAGLIKERTPVVSEMYKEALRGVDVDKRISEARAGVQHAFKGAGETLTRDLSRMGIDPTSRRGLTAFGGMGISGARAMADVEADVRREAEHEDFQRKVTASRIV
jgi:hypothetical protein